MKYLTEYRDAEKTKQLAEKISAFVSRTWKIMDVCGGQTHSIIRNGIDQILPSEIEMIQGPGCPVCVTPVETIDRALAVARTSYFVHSVTCYAYRGLAMICSKSKEPEAMSEWFIRHSTLSASPATIPSKTAAELLSQATGTIRRARESIDSLMSEGFIADPDTTG